jgi:hypothetical protein
VLRKNSVHTRKMMEMLSLVSLVLPHVIASTLVQELRLDALHLLIKIAFLPTRVCAILKHVSSRPHGFTLARFFLFISLVI